MVKAVVLIRCRAGTYKEVVRKLREMENVKLVFSSLGAYDVVSKIEANSLFEIGKIVRMIRSLENVNTTETLVEVKTDNRSV
ncbi:MAG: Lrp/AsnC ligand binding domain-containing protein [Candidatus Brockarchaeota archaeon]|nr:Lrp/AsnC ligand binding domain-containing protein [Candidatus Brockarchaeota archaeon]